MSTNSYRRPESFPLANAATTRPAFTPPEYEHTCTYGPPCFQMHDFIETMTAYADDPISREYGIYPAGPEGVTECDHLSCLTLIHEDCRACFTEAMDAYDADLNRDEGRF
jgi:hypothetical protein